MRGIEFPERTALLQKPPYMSEAECTALAVYQDKASGTVLSCWRMSLRERIAALVFGKVWVWVYTNSSTQPPIALIAERTPFAKQPEQVDA